MSVNPQPVQNADATCATRREQSAWFVLAILLLFSIAAPLNQAKAPPILPILMDAFHLSVVRAGLLMSVFALTGLVLALPAGFIFQKLGYCTTGLIAGGSIVLGTALGAISTDMNSMLVGRVIEGVGTSFMAVLAPAIIAVWFPVQKRGVAMGIWAAWFPIGSTTMLILAPRLAQWGSWQTVWWFGCAYALLATVLFLVLVKPTPAAAPSLLLPASPARVLRDRNVWLISLAFACFVMATTSSGTFLPTYLSVVRGMPLAQAALLSSVVPMVTIFSCPAGGMLSDRIGSRKRPYMLGLVMMALLMPLMAVIGTNALVALVVAQGLIGGLVPTNVFSAGVEVVGDERLGGLAMGAIMVGQNAGMLVGPVIFGALAESAGGWPLAFGSLAVMCLLGTLAGWLAKAR